MPFLTNFLQSRSRNRIRKILRGSRILKELGQQDRINIIKRILTEQSLNLIEKDFSSTMMGAGIKNGELIVRQYLLLRIGGLNFNKAILSSIGSKTGEIIYGMPKQWRRILRQNDFKVANFKSAVLWQIYILKLFLFGIYQINKILFNALFAKKIDLKEKLPYAYFADLTSNNLPNSDRNKKSHDILSWYLQSNSKHSDVNSIYHSANQNSSISIDEVPVKKLKNKLPELNGIKSISKFFLWGIFATIIASIDFLRGRWWSAFLLNQAALASQVRILPKGDLALEYMFHNSNWIFRPLWTYEAENKGCKVTFYFYSTNCEELRVNGKYPELTYGYKAMNWPNYLVWDGYQSNFIKRAATPPYNINIVGPIWMQGKFEHIEKSKKKYIAVFDVTPKRDSVYATLATEYDYYIPGNCVKFLYDSYNSINSNNCSMLWKRKRNIGNLAHPKYRRLAETLGNNHNIIQLDVTTSVWQIIEASSAVISMPYTSTALIARELGKPAVYYDSSGLLDKDDRAAHGITVVCGKKELQDWLEKVLDNNQV